ncbi:AMP-binding protein [Endozoicomonas sp.]|uniref:AMP-binding protein n=1 Tax=Endozoicomonas sp. TaxID=1892382 RepID=UPI00383BDB2C
MDIESMIPTQATLSLQSFFTRPADDQLALLDNEQPLSYTEVVNKSLTLASTIARSEEQYWGLYCEDTGHFIISLLALLAAGKTICLPANNQPGTLADLANHAAILLTDSHGDGFTGHCYQLPQLNTIVKDESFEPRTARASLIFFTSGSSGNPKAVHKQLWQLENEIQAQEQKWGETLENPVILACVAHQHIYGILFRILWPLLARRTIDTHQHQYPESLLAAIAQHDKVAVIASPAQLERLPKELNWSVCKHRVTAVFSSGAPLQARFAAEAQRCFSVLPLEILGSTESGGVAWRQQHCEPASLNAWQPLPGVHVQLDDNGLLTVFSPWLDNPEDCCVMGDRAEIIADHGFLLKGRADQIVKIEGKRVSLTEISQRLSDHYLVERTALTVLEMARQQLGAIVVLTDEGKAILNKQGRLAIPRLLKKTLSQYFEAVTLPRKWRFVEIMPVNAQGKLVHSELARLFTTGLPSEATDEDNG